MIDDRPTRSAAPVPRDWRQDVVSVDGIAVVLGLWLVISPVVLDYGTGDAVWPPIVCGAIAAALMLSQAVRRVRSSTPGLVLMALGVFLFVSGLWLADSWQASWNGWSAGALMFFLGAVSAAATQRAGDD